MEYHHAAPPVMSHDGSTRFGTTAAYPAVTHSDYPRRASKGLMPTPSRLARRRNRPSSRVDATWLGWPIHALRNAKRSVNLLRDLDLHGPASKATYRADSDQASERNA
jgi:hypothetical protein